jgi:hypothetical protein
MELIKGLLILIADIRHLWTNKAPRAPKFRPLHTYLQTKLNRTAAKLEILFEKWQNGWRPEPRIQASKRERPDSVRSTPHMPTKKGWFPLSIGEDYYQANGLGNRLEQIIHTPEFQQFVTDIPQAGRLMRPLATMFHTPIPPALERPKTDHPKRVMKPRAPRPPKPPAPPPAPEYDICMVVHGMPREEFYEKTRQWRFKKRFFTL